MPYLYTLLILQITMPYFFTLTTHFLLPGYDSDKLCLRLVGSDEQGKLRLVSQRI